MGLDRVPSPPPYVGGWDDYQDDPGPGIPWERVALSLRRAGRWLAGVLLGI